MRLGPCTDPDDLATRPRHPRCHSESALADEESLSASTPEALQTPGTRGDHELEHMVLQRLTPSWLAGKPFLPLPVLGLPGWSADNTQPEFYRDTQVFRPAPIPTVP